MKRPALPLPPNPPTDAGRHRSPRRSPRLTLALAAALGVGLAGMAQGGNLAVTPIRIDLSASERAGAVSVVNEDPGPLRTKVQLMAWSQDAEGRDVYADADTLIYHPRLLAVEPHGQRLIRMGLRQPVGDVEQTFRLFIEELPEPPAPGDPASGKVAIAVRFGVPVFVAPAQPRRTLALEGAGAEAGVWRVAVRNTGNQHVRLRSVQAVGADGQVLAQAEGWYLLAGARRVHALRWPAQACPKAGAAASAPASVTLTVLADDFEHKEPMAVPAPLCGR